MFKPSSWHNRQGAQVHVRYATIPFWYNTSRKFCQRNIKSIFDIIPFFKSCTNFSFVHYSNTVLFDASIPDPDTFFPIFQPSDFANQSIEIYISIGVVVNWNFIEFFPWFIYIQESRFNKLTLICCTHSDYRWATHQSTEHRIVLWKEYRRRICQTWEKLRWYIRRALSRANHFPFWSNLILCELVSRSRSIMTWRRPGVDEPMQMRFRANMNIRRHEFSGWNKCFSNKFRTWCSVNLNISDSRLA